MRSDIWSISFEIEGPGSESEELNMLSGESSNIKFLV